jgi:hypothetical protein
MAIVTYLLFIEQAVYFDLIRKGYSFSTNLAFFSGKFWHQGNKIICRESEVKINVSFHAGFSDTGQAIP